MKTVTVTLRGGRSVEARKRWAHRAEAAVLQHGKVLRRVYAATLDGALDRALRTPWTPEELAEVDAAPPAV